MDTSWMVVVVLLLVLGVLAVASANATRAERRLASLERKLDLVLGSLGAAPPAPDLTQVRELVRAGKQIQAVKRYRELTDAGLREAKEAVDRLAGDEGQLR